jgi:hypothetical protein
MVYGHLGLDGLNAFISIIYFLLAQWSPCRESKFICLHFHTYKPWHKSFHKSFH